MVHHDRLPLVPDNVESLNAEPDRSLDDALSEAIASAWLGEEHWRKSQDVISQAIREMHEAHDEVSTKICEVLNSEGLPLGYAHRGNREQQRMLESIGQRRNQALQGTVIDVRFQSFNDESTDDSKAKLQKDYEILAQRQLEKYKMPEDQKAHLTNLLILPHLHVYDRAAPLYVDMYREQRISLDKVYGHLAENPQDLASLIVWLENNVCNEDPVNLPLLTLLANDIYDPSSYQFSDSFWNKVHADVENLDLLEDFLAYILGDTIDIESRIRESLTLSSLRLARAVFPGTDDEFAVALKEARAAWGTGLEDAYTKFKHILLETAQFHIAELLEPYVRRSQFQPFSKNRLSSHRQSDSTNHIKSAKKRRGSRTTPKRLSGQVLSSLEDKESDAQKFRGYRKIVRTEHGYDVLDADQAYIDSTINEYCRNQDRDPRVREDLVKMLESIISLPVGHGATKYTDGHIQVGNKKYSLMHLTPTKRPGLSLQTATAKKTRFVYALVPTGSGGFYIALHRIWHKNDIDSTGASIINRS